MPVPMTAVDPSDRLLTAREVAALIGVHHKTIHRWIQAGTFPRPLQIGVQMSRWSRREIDAWIAARPRKGEEVGCGAA